MEEIVLNCDVLPKDPKLAEGCDIYKCNGYSIPSFGIKFLKSCLHSYEARKDDLYIASYPKTGTTWVMEIVYLIHSDLDFDSMKQKSLYERFPYLEHSMTNMEYVTNMPAPRRIKTHFPYSLLPPVIHEKKCKIVYVTRNPKDVVVSYYHFACWLKESQYKGTFDQFFDRFVADRPTYSPFLQHNLEFWQHWNDDNILFLFYEDLHKDLPKEIQKIASFLGKTLSNEHIEKIIAQTSFQSMSGKSANKYLKDEDAGKFFRRGHVGDWKNYFSEAQSKKIDEMVEETLNGTGLKYTYEL